MSDESANTPAKNKIDRKMKALYDEFIKTI